MATTNDILLSLIDKAVDDRLAFIFQRFDNRIEDLVKSISRQHLSISTNLNLMQVAEFLQLPPATIYKYTSTRQIPHKKIGKHLIFEKGEIIEWLKGFSVKTKSDLEHQVLTEFVSRKDSTKKRQT